MYVTSEIKTTNLRVFWGFRDSERYGDIDCQGGSIFRIGSAMAEPIFSQFRELKHIHILLLCIQWHLGVDLWSSCEALPWQDCRCKQMSIYKIQLQYAFHHSGFMTLLHCSANKGEREKKSDLGRLWDWLFSNYLVHYAGSILQPTIRNGLENASYFIG